jgi:hypothetical protein
VADHQIATYGMEGVTAERIRPPWDQLPNHSGRGAEADRRRFGAIAMLAFVRILLFLATAAGARQLTTQGTATLIGDAPIARSPSREIALH